MSLKQWRDNDWLVPHQTSAREIEDLIAIADRDLKDATSARLSDDWRFGIAYNAALQLATAALYAAGFKAQRGQSHHLRAIQSLQYTIGLKTELLDQLDAFRAKRHTGTYDAAGAVSKAEADRMIELARELRSVVESWIKRNHTKFWPR